MIGTSTVRSPIFRECVTLMQAFSIIIVQYHCINIQLNHSPSVVWPVLRKTFYDCFIMKGSIILSSALSCTEYNDDDVESTLCTFQTKTRTDCLIKNSLCHLLSRDL